VDIIASESVDTFDRNGWSTSIGMGGQDRPEYACCFQRGAHALAVTDHNGKTVRSCYLALYRKFSTSIKSEPL